jgi:OOP family OmpA-OmpF porin
MKHNSKISSALLISVGAALLLSACGTRHISRDISPQGVAGDVIFPEPAQIVMKGGTFPNSGVRECDYLFHFRKDDQVITCQYKVVYDKDYLAQTFHWAPASCADLLVEATPVTNEIKERHFDLSADALFEFAKYGADDIRPMGREELTAIAGKLKDADNVSIKVVGHTDRIGSDAANQLLSQRRAQTVREFLADRGVAASAITSEGRGESEPVKDCEEQARAALIACLAPNRRVEIRVGTSSAD